MGAKEISWVTWPKWLPSPFMVKAIKNLFLQHQALLLGMDGIRDSSTTEIVQMMALG